MSGQIILDTFYLIIDKMSFLRGERADLSILLNADKFLSDYSQKYSQRRLF